MHTQIGKNKGVLGQGQTWFCQFVHLCTWIGRTEIGVVGQEQEDLVLQNQGEGGAKKEKTQLGNVTGF